VAIFQRAPDYTKYETLCSVLNNPNDKPVAFSLHAVTDDEATDNEGSEGDDESSENDLASVVEKSRKATTMQDKNRSSPISTCKDFKTEPQHLPLSKSRKMA
jgi:hypothetical protein